MIIIITLLVIFVIAGLLYMQQAQFGKMPAGKRLERIKESANFREGKFQNVRPTPDLTEGYSMSGVIYNFFFNKSPRRSPVDSLPSVKTDLLNLSIDQDILVWFGHSSYFIQLDGKRILVDPVLSGGASPIPGTNPSFRGTDIYTAADLPVIDYLFISHDHYDHLDHATLMALQDKVKKVVCGLGVGAHFEHWGYPESKIMERDWHEAAVLDTGFTAFVTPARHFSGRTLGRNRTLWASYVLQTPTMKIFLGGDSGYDTHFADIGNRFGPIDLAILENGQYDRAWRYVHTLPEEVLKVATDLKARRVFPVHSSKFALANHSWDEPLTKITELNQTYRFPLATPMIGEPVQLKNPDQKFKQWWLGLR